MSASTQRNKNPKVPDELAWPALCRAWWVQGRTGLTLPFACAGSGTQPTTFVRALLDTNIRRKLGFCIDYCNFLRFPILGREILQSDVAKIINPPISSILALDEFSKATNIDIGEHGETLKWVIANAYSVSTWIKTGKISRGKGSCPCSRCDFLYKKEVIEFGKLAYKLELFTSASMKDWVNHLIVTYVRNKIMEGNVSAYGNGKDGQFTESDIHFIQQVLGPTYPPDIIGLTSEGNIDYGVVGGTSTCLL